MKLSLSIAVVALTIGAFSGSVRADTAEPWGVAEALERVDSLLGKGDLEGAVVILLAASEQLDSDDALSDRFTVHYALGLLRARLDVADGAVSAYIEAIALADALERMETPGFVGSDVTTRLELSAHLRRWGRFGEAEGLDWDALATSIALDQRGTLAAVVGSLTMSVLAQETTDEELRGFLEELDEELHGCEGYRLSLPPPPEPIFLLLEETAARLLAEDEGSEALALFEGILRLDRARGADWRLVSDLSSVAFAALMVDELPAARAVLGETEGLLEGGLIPADVWANRCYLAAIEGAWDRAHTHCLAGLAAARAAGDELRSLALTSRLAGLYVLTGRPDRSVSLYEDAAQGYEKAGLDVEAASERAQAVIELAESRRFDEGLRLLGRIDTSWEGRPAHPRIEEARQRLALQMLLVSFESSDAEEITAALQSIGGYLFETGRSEDLSRLSLLYLELALRRDGESGREQEIDEALAAILGLEEQLGLGKTGWVGEFARGIVHDDRGEDSAAREAWQEALEGHEEELLWRSEQGGPLREWLGRAERPFYRRLDFEPHSMLLGLLQRREESSEGLSVVERVMTVRRAMVWREPAAGRVLRPRSPAEHRVEQLLDERRHLVATLKAVSLQGGEVHPAEQREALSPLLVENRRQFEAALEALSPDRVRVFAPGRASGGAGGSDEIDSSLVVRAGAGFYDYDCCVGTNQPSLGGWPTGGAHFDQNARAVGQRGKKGREAESFFMSSLELLPLQEPRRLLLGTDDPLSSLPFHTFKGTWSQPVAESILIIHRPSANGTQEPPQGLEESAGLPLHDLSAWTCEVGRGGLASVFLVAPSDPERIDLDGLLPGERLGPAEISQLDLAGRVILPHCAPVEKDMALYGRSLQDQAFFDAGALEIVRLMRPVGKRPREMFLAVLKSGLGEGRALSDAFLEAQTAVRKRWRNPRAWAPWSLSSVLAQPSR